MTLSVLSSLQPPVIIMSLLDDGGTTFMYPLLLLLFACIGLAIYGFTKGDREHTIKLISSVSLFALVWGFLGQTLGLIGALDHIESLDKIAPQIIGAGIKTTLLPAAFGMLVFLVGRLGIIALQMKKG